MAIALRTKLAPRMWRTSTIALLLFIAVAAVAAAHLCIGGDLGACAYIPQDPAHLHACGCQ